MAGLSIVRRPGQTVVIETPGFALVVNVESSSRGKVHLNFLGPAEVKVWRGELFGAIRGFDVYDRLVVEGTDAVETADR
ncbi:MAG: carbon storage regulator [Planctomycetales bacterium]|nr:carbon storage regulator [Planctomycetales bacterium]